MRSATGSKTLMAAIRTHHPQIGHGWLSLFFIVYLLNHSYSPKYISDNRDRGSCRFTFFSKPLCNISANFLRNTSSIYCWGETTFELSEEALSKDKIIITVVWFTLKILILFYAKSCSRCVTVLMTLIRWKTRFLYGYFFVNINNTRKILNSYLNQVYLNMHVLIDTSIQEEKQKEWKKKKWKNVSSYVVVQ